jgi:hypothetical protein
MTLRGIGAGLVNLSTELSASSHDMFGAGVDVGFRCAAPALR